MTRPEKDRFSVREQEFIGFPYPVSNILEFEKNHFSYRKMREITGLRERTYMFIEQTQNATLLYKNAAKKF